jgi:hypothetical protein
MSPWLATPGGHAKVTRIGMTASAFTLQVPPLLRPPKIGFLSVASPHLGVSSFGTRNIPPGPSVPSPFLLLSLLERLTTSQARGGPWKSPPVFLGAGGEYMCLPLAQGERQRNRRKLLLHLLRAEAAAPSPLIALPPAAARRRPGATALSFPTLAQL